MAIRKIGTTEFEQEVLGAARPVAVDFMADWCGYCRRLSPALERAAQKAGQAAEVVQVDIDEGGELARRYRVDTIPTLILFAGGKETARVVNPPSQAAVESWLRENGVAFG